MKRNVVKKKEPVYETKITDAKWIAFDIPGNIGWILYFAGVIFSFVKRQDYMQYYGMTVVLIVAVVPAILMAVGLVELINERICKLDRVLPRRRLLRGFGALTVGGIAGICVSVAGIIYGFLIASDVSNVYLAVMCIGAMLCAIFSGLLYKGYHVVSISGRE